MKFKEENKKRYKVVKILIPPFITKATYIEIQILSIKNHVLHPFSLVYSL